MENNNSIIDLLNFSILAMQDSSQKKDDVENIKIILESLVSSCVNNKDLSLMKYIYDKLEDKNLLSKEQWATFIESYISRSSLLANDDVKLIEKFRDNFADYSKILRDKINLDNEVNLENLNLLLHDYVENRLFFSVNDLKLVRCILKKIEAIVMEETYYKNEPNYHLRFEASKLKIVNPKKIIERFSRLQDKKITTDICTHSLLALVFEHNAAISSDSYRILDFTNSKINSNSAPNDYLQFIDLVEKDFVKALMQANNAKIFFNNSGIPKIELAIEKIIKMEEAGVYIDKPSLLRKILNLDAKSTGQASLILKFFYYKLKSDYSVTKKFSDLFQNEIKEYMPLGAKQNELSGFSRVACFIKKNFNKIAVLRDNKALSENLLMIAEQFNLEETLSNLVQHKSKVKKI